MENSKFLKRTFTVEFVREFPTNLAPSQATRWTQSRFQSNIPKLVDDAHRVRAGNPGLSKHVPGSVKFLDLCGHPARAAFYTHRLDANTFANKG